ncbi:MAG: DNA (cytosine-5-)-methyltransferase [Bacteroidales bacterium]|nr:DNA (cytosine-5-)-methyltransferase [Bacteroidales bacterium]
MIRILELFAGIGACSKALTNLGIEHEIVDAVEIDKYAIKSFNAIHGTNFEPQDITKWNKDIKADLIMHGSPCQDFSVAGKNAGGDEGSGTRSSLLYETLRIVEKVQPDIVIWENVKNLLSKRHKHNHEAYIQRMSDMGYDSVTQILNAKDYGIPQNRERVFTLSIKRGSKLVKSYVHPQPRPLEIRLKDILEDEVEERYYLTDEQVASFVASTERAKAKGNGFKFEPFERERERVMHAVLSRAGSRQTDNFIKESSAESKRSTVTTSSSASTAQMDARQHSAQCKAETPSQKSSHRAAEGSITCNI